jgi:hypothetical protein
MSKTNTSKRRREKGYNPALRIRDFYSFSLQILNEINYAREHPDEFLEKIKELQETVQDSKDNCLYIENVPFVYSDLLGSLDNSIKFLEKQKELPRLIYNKSITQACDYLLDELLAHDGLDDENANIYSLENRLNKFGRPFGESYELIDYGMFDPEFIVINFVLGDGDKNKFERNVIFNPKVKYIGIASGILSSEKICTIINCCEEFYDTYDRIPADILEKYNKKPPSFNTKTINNYSGKSGNSTNVERYTSNTKKEGNVEEQFTEEINTKRGDSGDVYSVKKTEYIKKKESAKDNNNDKKDARIPLRNKKTKNEPKNYFDFFEDDEDFDEDDFFDKEFDIHFGDNYRDKKDNKTSKKTTTTTTTTDDNGMKKTVVTTVTEEIDGRTGGRKRQYYEEEGNNNNKEENKQKSRKSKVKEREERERREREEREKQRREEREKEEQEEKEELEKRERERIERQKQIERQRQREYERELELQKEKEKEKEKEKQDNTKYKKKIIEIPIKLKPKKNEQFDDGTYKTVQDYPSHKKGYYEKEFERGEEDIENENEYPTDYRVKRPKYNISEDLYEKEEDMELPEGASTMQVRQKTITDSKGNPALIIKKTITYEDGSVKTIIEKKPLNKK